MKPALPDLVESPARPASAAGALHDEPGRSEQAARPAAGRHDAAAADPDRAVAPAVDPAPGTAEDTGRAARYWPQVGVNLLDDLRARDVEAAATLTEHEGPARRPGTAPDARRAARTRTPLLVRAGDAAGAALTDATDAVVSAVARTVGAVRRRGPEPRLDVRPAAPTTPHALQLPPDEQDGRVERPRAAEQPAQDAPWQEAALVCAGLTARYRNRTRPTISDIDVVVPKNGVLAVVGPSGSGKSTMCGAILGEIEDVCGHVLVDGVSLPEVPALAPRMVSFVPQRDALHNELTPQQALRLVADLRLAPSVPKAERERRVAEVLSLLELASHAHRRIGQLSGGQRKRVAVAMELLSNPRLLMLDEPTSGLDEGLDLVMMRLLRKVADSGCGVLVVTHSTANLGLADVVLALDIHGKVAFSGPPEQFLTALGVTTYAEAMADLRDGRATAETLSRELPPITDDLDLVGLRALADARAAELVREGWVVPARAEIAAAVARRRRGVPPGLPPEAALWHTLGVLVRRELTRFTASKVTVARGLLVLPALAALLAAWASDDGLRNSVDAPNPWQGVALSVLVTCTTFFAMAMSFSSVVGDRDVIEREYRWGVRPVAVVAAKMLAVGGPVAIQSVIAVALFLLMREGPNDPLDIGAPYPMLTLACVALGLSSAALGLLVSASSPTLERAILMLMGFVALLVVLNGLLIPLAHPEGFGGHALAVVAHVTPSRWGAAALASYVGYVPDPLPGAPPGDTSLLDALWIHDTGHFTDALTSMGSLGVTYVVAAMFILTRQCGRRR